jgi:hypothetical protein
MPQKLFALLSALLISSLTLAIAEKPPTLPQISEQTLSTIDSTARNNFTPPISDEDAKRFLSQSEVRTAVEHGRLVEMMSTCGMDGESESTQFILNLMKEGWTGVQVDYMKALQQESVKYFTAPISKQGCSATAKQYIAENKLDKDATKFTFPFPGQTVASPELQKDALIMVIAAANANHDACKAKVQAKTMTYTDAFVTHTKLLNMPKPIGKTPTGLPLLSPWDENWTVNACGTIRQIKITFIPKPDGVGTTFKVDVPK